MKCQFWARASFPQDKGNRELEQSPAPAHLLDRALGGGRRTQGSPGLGPQPWPGSVCSGSSVSMSLSPHNGQGC